MNDTTRGPRIGLSHTVLRWPVEPVVQLYYLYVYAQRRTSVSFLVTAAKSSCGGNNKKAKKVSLTLLAILLPIAFVIAIIICVAYCCWAGVQVCNPANHRPTEEPAFEAPATGQIDQPVSAGYGHGTPVTATPVASAPPVEQSSGWTWSKATPAQQANRTNMCL